MFDPTDHHEQQGGPTNPTSSRPTKLATTRKSRTRYHHLQCQRILDYWSEYDMVGTLVLETNAEYLSYHMETKTEGPAGEHPTSDISFDS